jgi:hypothetical protein
MHNKNAEGELQFVCDFCAKPWTDSLPMVEGHRGSLICGQCVSIAFSEVVHLRTGNPVEKEETCVLCLESDRPGLHWRSPVREQAVACVRCIKQSAGVLHKDSDEPWSKPSSPDEQ